MKNRSPRVPIFFEEKHKNLLNNYLINILPKILAR